MDKLQQAFDELRETIKDHEDSLVTRYLDAIDLTQDPGIVLIKVGFAMGYMRGTGANSPQFGKRTLEKFWYTYNG